MNEPVCELTELTVSSCHHCRAKTRVRRPALATCDAMFYGTCQECAATWQPGDRIAKLAEDGEWIHWKCL